MVSGPAILIDHEAAATRSRPRPFTHPSTPEFGYSSPTSPPPTYMHSLELEEPLLPSYSAYWDQEAVPKHAAGGHAFYASKLRRMLTNRRFTTIFALLTLSLLFLWHLAPEYLFRLPSSLTPSSSAQLPKVSPVPFATSNPTSDPGAGTPEQAATDAESEAAEPEDWLSKQTKLLNETRFFQSDGTVNGSWDETNELQIAALLNCFEGYSCRPNQDGIVIVVGAFFFDSPAYVGGEVMWARSTLIALKNAGYTYLYAANIPELLDLYSLFPDHVKAVIMDDFQMEACVQASEVVMREDHHQSSSSAGLDESESESDSSLELAADSGIDADFGFGGHHHHHSESHHDFRARSHQVQNRDRNRNRNRNRKQDQRQEQDRLQCLKSPTNPDGIPIWKLFNFHFWQGSEEHVLDSRWVLSPENYWGINRVRGGGAEGADHRSHNNSHLNSNTSDASSSSLPVPIPPSPATRTGENQYLGYTVEPSCLSVPYIPPLTRPEGQAYILAKRYSYFTPGLMYTAWPLGMWDYVASLSSGEGDGEGVKFVAGALDDHEDPDMVGRVREFRMMREEELRAGRGGGVNESHVGGTSGKEMDREMIETMLKDIKIPARLPSSIENLGLMAPDVFIAKVAESRVLVGVGSPLLSPTPYEALCLGVPFINPILLWDPNDPSDRSHWGTQHQGLLQLDPPYVYHVHKDDTEGFVRAIKQALDNPIERFILPDMTHEAVEERLKRIFDVDWKVEAARLLEEREESGVGQLFVL